MLPGLLLRNAPWSCIAKLSIQQKCAKRIGHLGDFAISQVANLFLDQLANVLTGEWILTRKQEARAYTKQHALIR